MAENRVLLPDAVTPSKYTLSLSPDLEKFTFDGEVSIAVNVSNATNSIVSSAPPKMKPPSSFYPGL